MTTYRKESHIRSLLKGISWRVIATTDTIFVALMITCLFGICSIEDALAIGTVEFFLKFVIYYVHERIWQEARSKKGVSPRQTLYKSVSWRLIATTMTFIISGTVLDRFDEIALYIALTELFTKFVLYYLHERLWLKIPLGKIRNYVYKKILKR